MKRLYVLIVFAFLVFSVGCDTPQSVLSVLDVAEGGDVVFPEIQHSHSYDQDVLRISWDAVPDAQGYVVFLQEDYLAGLGLRRNIFHQIFVDADEETAALLVRDDEYFIHTSPGKSKYLEVGILPVSGKLPDHNDVDFYPGDYDDYLVGDPVRISFFWHQRSGEIDHLRQVLESLGLMTLEYVRWNIIPVSEIDEIWFDPPPASVVLMDIRYEISAYHLGAVVYTNVYYGANIGREDLSITLPYRVVADTVRIRAIWEIGGGDNVVGEWFEVSRE